MPQILKFQKYEICLIKYQRFKKHKDQNKKLARSQVHLFPQSQLCYIFYHYL